MLRTRDGGGGRCGSEQDDLRSHEEAKAEEVEDGGVQKIGLVRFINFGFVVNVLGLVSKYV